MSAKEIKDHEEQIEIRIYKTQRRRGEEKRFWKAQYYFSKPETIIDILNFLNSKCESGPILQGWIEYLEKVILEKEMREECMRDLKGLEG